MEGKSVMLSVFIMSLVIAQTQVEAKLCCPSTTARNIHNTCRIAGGSRAFLCKTQWMPIRFRDMSLGVY
ncbi:unnamed protein product [Cochlearia groenlandica]